MNKNQQIFYGLPKAGGPTELPPPIVLRPGFGAYPDQESDEYETVGNPMMVMEGLEMPPMEMQKDFPPMDYIPEGFPPMGMPPAEMAALGAVTAEEVPEPLILVCDDQFKISKTYAFENGTVNTETAENIDVKSGIPELNFLLAAGNSEYTLKNAKLDMGGDGKNDFDGNGAAVKVTDCADVTLDDCNFCTKGILHSCLFAGDYGRLTVNNSRFVCDDGGLDPKKFVPAGPGMTQAPASMEVSGHSRLSLACGNAHCYFNNCRFESDAWAALSTDASWGDTYLEVNDSDIVVRKPGYATFADEGTVVVMNNTNIKTASHCGMICGKAKLKFNRCSLESDKYAVFIFAILSSNGSQLGELTVNNCDVHSREDIFLLKGTNAYLDIRNSRLKADNGCIIRTGKFEDIMATKINPGEPLYGYKILFSDMQVEGDIIHEDPDRAMVVKLSHTKLKGAINGAAVLIDAASEWKATGDSKIRIIRKINENNLDADSGVTIFAYSTIEKEHKEIKLKSGGMLIIN